MAGEIMTLADVKRQHWIEVLKACKESNQPVAVWCRENHIAESSYWYWHKKFGDEIATRNISGLPEFVEMNELLCKKTDKTASIQMEKNGIHLNITNDVSEDLILKVMRCLSNV